MKSPLAHRNIGALDWCCLRAIGFYQRRISPRKGWRCAHARLHGGTGCSGFAREAIETDGWRAALPLVRARFDSCKLAGRQIRAQQSGRFDATDSDKNAPNATRRKSCSWLDGLDCSACYACDLLDVFFACGPGDTGCCDLPDCNCSPCD